MLLTVGQSYLLSTKKQTISKIKVKVIGFVDYNEALKIPYNIRTLAINEKVMAEDGQDSTYLEKQVYYKCVVLDNDDSTLETSAYVAVWDEVIDTTSTTQLYTDYILSTTIKIDPNAEITLEEVRSSIIQMIQEKYQNEVEISLKVQNSVSNGSVSDQNEANVNELDAMREVLNEAKNTLLSIANLNNTAQNTAEKLKNLNISNQLPEISERLEAIQTNVESIYTMIK